MAVLVSSGMHFGGVLGGGGLAIVAAGCAFLQSQQASAFWPLPVAATANLERQETAATPADIDAPVAVPAIVQAAPQSSLAEQPDVLPASAPPTLAAVREARQGPPAATGPTQPATFIVKFRETPQIDDVIANWRRDKEAAKAIFSTWSADDPVFSSMTIEDCSYSGELILQADIPAAPATARQSVNDILGRIRGHSAVAYADPDFTAQPGMTEN